MLVFKQQVFHCPQMTDHIQQCLQIAHNGMQKGFCLLLWRDPAFVEIKLPTLESPHRRSPSLFPAFLRTASVLACQPAPSTLLKNTLDSHANGSRGTETLCLLHAKTIHWISCNQFFPHHGNTFCDGYAHPSNKPS